MLYNIYRLYIIVAAPDSPLSVVQAISPQAGIIYPLQRIQQTLPLCVHIDCSGRVPCE